MRKLLTDPFAWAGFIVILACAFILSACQKERPVQVGSTVKIVLKSGHGSGVNLGNGFILTAGHVGAEETLVTVKMEDGATVEGRVLWASFSPLEVPDVSLIYVDPKRMERAASASLSCTRPKLGQMVRIVGNPKAAEFITTWGRVGRAIPQDEDGFRFIIALDATATNGVSGGPVFDDVTGDLIGLLVSGLPGTGYSFMTPGFEICRYMGRVA